MNRRGFLQLVGMGAAGVALGGLELDPERALWVPGAKTFFLPPEPVYRSGCNNLWVDMDGLITREALKILENRLVYVRQINRLYDGTVFPVDGAQVGYTVTVRKPLRFSGLSDPETWT